VEREHTEVLPTPDYDNRDTETGRRPWDFPSVNKTVPYGLEMILIRIEAHENERAALGDRHIRAWVIEDVDSPDTLATVASMITT